MEQEKSTYTKTEIEQKLGVQAYIIALWEKQFGIEATVSHGEQLYSAQDLVKLASIKELLYEKGFSIDAAKRYVHENPVLSNTTIMAASPLLFASKKEPQAPVLIPSLLNLQQQLIKLRNLL